MAWGIGGWLLTPFLRKIGPEALERLRKQVAAGLTTTFASSYTDRVSLAGALQLQAITAYTRQATGSKYLIIPSLLMGVLSARIGGRTRPGRPRAARCRGRVAVRRARG